MRVVFMGTPEIAATCLEGLLTGGFDVVAVYTKPDTPQNRGMKLTQSPVKQLAQAHGVPVYQPAGFRDAARVEELRALKPDVIAVVAYGRILPQAVLDIPSRGCINIHASLLPALRGSGPVQWAVLRGLEETGVTAMYMAAEMDAGDMIATRRTPIDPNENAQSLLDRLAKLGAELLAETLTRLAQGPVAATPQDHTKATFAPMLTKDLCPIDWSRTPPGDLEPHPGPGPLACGHHGAAGQALSGLQGGPPGENHKPDPRHAPGRDPDRPGDGLRRGRRAGDPGFAGRRGKRMAAPDYFRGHPLAL